MKTCVNQVSNQLTVVSANLRGEGSCYTGGREGGRERGREGEGLTVSIPLQSILSCLSGLEKKRPAYRFLLIRR